MKVFKTSTKYNRFSFNKLSSQSAPAAFEIFPDKHNKDTQQRILPSSEQKEILSTNAKSNVTTVDVFDDSSINTNTKATPSTSQIATSKKPNSVKEALKSADSKECIDKKTSKIYKEIEEHGLLKKEESHSPIAKDPQNLVELCVSHKPNTEIYKKELESNIGENLTQDASHKAYENSHQVEDDLKTPLNLNNVSVETKSKVNSTKNSVTKESIEEASLSNTLEEHTGSIQNINNAKDTKLSEIKDETDKDSESELCIDAEIPKINCVEVNTKTDNKQKQTPRTDRNQRKRKNNRKPNNPAENKRRSKRFLENDKEKTQDFDTLLNAHLDKRKAR